MPNLQTLFWIAIAIVFYSFFGYGILLYLVVKIKSVFIPKKKKFNYYCPEVTLVIPCYNECSILESKIENCLKLDYPKEKLKLVFITDGSTDDSVKLLKEFPFIQNLHISRRGGKTAAQNRAMALIETPIVLFSDANTLLNVEAVLNIIRHFADEKVGYVCGEKKILTQDADIPGAAGEGIYWKYESWLKKLDSELYSAVGAAGELVAFRKDLYETLPEDVMLDDFMQSMLIAGKGYKIVYEPNAWAMETPAASVSEELKRKIRISAGRWQSTQRLSGRISVFTNPVLFFQYFSHRVLRWTVNPFLLVFIYVANAFLLREHIIYLSIFGLQFMFYAASYIGYLFETKQMKIKAFFIPYYFCIMNYAVVCGLIRFLKGSQSVIWEKNVRIKGTMNDKFSEALLK